MKKKRMETEAVRMLKRDHKRIMDLLFHFEQSEDPMHKLSFAQTAMNEIAIHSVIEQECLYPMLLTREKKKLTRHVHESEKEHELMDELMTRLGQKEEYDDAYHELFCELARSFKEHIETEEDELLPLLEEVATDELAKQMIALKNELLSYDMPNGRQCTPQVLLFEELRHRRTSA